MSTELSPKLKARLANLDKEFNSLLNPQLDQIRAGATKPALKLRLVERAFNNTLERMRETYSQELKEINSLIGHNPRHTHPALSVQAQITQQPNALKPLPALAKLDKTRRRSSIFSDDTFNALLNPDIGITHALDKHSNELKLRLKSKPKAKLMPKLSNRATPKPKPY